MDAPADPGGARTSRRGMSNQSGKQTEAQPFDLLACVSYQICGKDGVLSYPHIDHHSLLNTAFVDNEEKLWPLWGRLSDVEFAQWATSDIAPEPALYQH